MIYFTNAVEAMNEASEFLLSKHENFEFYYFLESLCKTIKSFLIKIQDISTTEISKFLSSLSSTFRIL